MPLFGSLTHKMAVARFSRTLGTLLESGVPMLTALSIVKNVVNNRLIADSIAEASRDVEEGQNLSATLSRNKLFPPIVTQMISAGEQSGTLEKMLYKVSDSLETEVESNITLDPLNEYGFLCFSIPGKFSEMMHSVTFFAGYFTIVILMAAPAHRITIRSIKPSISR